MRTFLSQEAAEKNSACGEKAKSEMESSGGFCTMMSLAKSASVANVVLPEAAGLLKPKDICVNWRNVLVALMVCWWNLFFIFLC